MENNDHQSTTSESTDDSEAGQGERVGDAYFKSLPPGIRFEPTDEELIENYLKKKVMNQELPINRIFDVDLYSYDPETLTGKYKLIRAQEWYFFTQIPRKYPEGQRPGRKAGEGYWKLNGTNVAIPERNPQGYRKSLNYLAGKHPDGVKTDWMMHEYGLHDTAVDSAPSSSSNKRGRDSKMLDGWFLCKVFRKSDKGKTGAARGNAEANSSHSGDTAADSQWEYGSCSQSGGQVGYADMGNQVEMDGVSSSSSNPLMNAAGQEEDSLLLGVPGEELPDHPVDHGINPDVSDDEGEQKFKADD